MKIVSAGILGVVLVMVFGAPPRLAALIAIAFSLVLSIFSKKKRVRNG
jgi:hypothetical protein